MVNNTQIKIIERQKLFRWQKAVSHLISSRIIKLLHRPKQISALTFQYALPQLPSNINIYNPNALKKWSSSPDAKSIGNVLSASSRGFKMNLFLHISKRWIAAIISLGSLFQSLLYLCTWSYLESKEDIDIWSYAVKRKVCISRSFWILNI